MSDFFPIWVTPAKELASVREDDDVRIDLRVNEVMTIEGERDQFIFAVGPNAPRVKTIKTNGAEVPFIVNAEDIHLASPLTLNAIVEIFLEPALIFSVINGTLPPGLTLNRATGSISGKVANIYPADPREYRFTVRASNGTRVRDRSFIITASGIDYAAYLNLDSLPAPEYSSDVHLTYRPIARLERAVPLSFSVDASDPDGVLPPMEVRPVTGLPDVPGIHGGLPPGLALEGTSIQGVVGAQAKAGRYFFTMTLVDPIAPTSIVFMVEVLDSVDDGLRLPVTIEWATPSGALDVLHVGEPSFLGVEANLTGATDIRYVLAPGSGPLPEGLALDEITGEIRGVAKHVLHDSSFPFVVRAISGQAFLDRDFSITVRSQYTTDNILELSLRLSVTDRTPLLRPYGSLITADDVFRPSDANFGIVRSPAVYLISGLDGSKDLEAALTGDGSPSINGEDYHGPIGLMLGEHRVALARNTAGEVVYEVLYRTLYDPQANAGGFASASGTPVEQKVVYPQSGSETRFIHPISLRNIRNDLARDVGFPVAMGSMRNHLGPKGPEGMPRWMRTEQTLGAPSSVLGFQPALVIAYLKPGRSAAVLRALEMGEDKLVPTGRIYDFDKYFMGNEHLVALTYFDGENTRFDHTTSFDGRIGHRGKYIP